VGLVVAAITYSLYQLTQNLLEDRLKDRVRSIAIAASISLRPEDLEQIHGPADVGSDPFVRVTRTLQEIRATSKDIYYAYILRPTEDPNVQEYIADADSIDPEARIDLNHDGVIDEQDALVHPGDPYEVGDIPALRDEAPWRATTDAEPVQVDAYGMFLSAYAPIQKDGRTVGILCLDVEVSDYLRLVTETFQPFLAFVLALFGLLTIMTYLLLWVWSRQVRIIAEIDRQKDELLGIVAHQLRNPITATNWSMESILDGDFGPIPGEAAGQLKQVEVKMKGLSELVELLVDVSKIELGRLAMNRSAVDLSQFFEEIVRNIVPQAGAKKIDFARAVPADLGEGKIDQRLTHMTIENLLSNAVKYTPEGGRVDLTVTLEERLLTVVVRDTGMGIPKADQGKIFGKLYRASNVLTLDGNGFGLYVARGAIEQQGGTIRFESEEGKGTTFRVTLPIDPA